MRDALGAPLPVGVPEAFTEPVRDPLGDLVARYARTHGPFHAADCASRLGLGVAVVAATLERLAATGRVAAGEFRPGGTGHRVVRRRGAAHAAPAVAGRAAQGGRAGAARRRWPGSCRPGRASGRGPAVPTGCCGRSSSWPGAAVPASALETTGAAVPGGRLLPRPAGRADRGRRGGLGRRRRAARRRRLGGAGAGRRGRPAAAGAGRAGPVRPAPARCWTRWTAARRCSSARCPTGSARPTTPALVAALWDLVWAGLLTNDTLAPLRALLGATGRTGAGRGAGRAPRSRYGRRGPAGDAVPDRAADRGRPVVPAAATATTTRPGGRTRRPRCCSTGTAC